MPLGGTTMNHPLIMNVDANALQDFVRQWEEDSQIKRIILRADYFTGLPMRTEDIVFTCIEDLKTKISHGMGMSHNMWPESLRIKRYRVIIEKHSQ